MDILSGDHTISLINNPLRKYREEQPNYVRYTYSERLAIFMLPSLQYHRLQGNIFFAL